MRRLSQNSTAAPPFRPPVRPILGACLLLTFAGCKPNPPAPAPPAGKPATAVPAAGEPRSASQPAQSPAPNPPANTAKDWPGGSPPPVLGPVQLQPQPDLLAGQVDAFPRVLPGPAVTPEVAAKINAALTTDERAARSSLLECQTGFKNQLKELHLPVTVADVNQAWQRSIDVTMRGPRFLSYVMATSTNCGGAYPELARSSSIVFDLTTGKPVSWDRLMPNGTKAVRGYLSDGLAAGWLQIPRIQKDMYKEAGPDCKDVFDPSFEQISFELYPDARKGALTLNPPDIRHVARTCEQAISLTQPDLVKLGAPPEVWQAIATAYDLQPKPPARR